MSGDYIGKTLVALGGSDVHYDPAYPGWRAEFPLGGVAVKWPLDGAMTVEQIKLLVGEWAVPPSPTSPPAEDVQ